VTSVVFGDLVGFTPLSESRDAEEVRELLSRYFAECRTVIGRYGGTVEKFIGDAVMAVWGVPTAHEDDAERAVRAGLELVAMVAGLGEQVGAPDLSMRVGVVTGEVAVTIGATAEGMVAGDAVNTASRVQSTATPGQVWVDDTTRALTSSAISYADAGEHTLKGKSEPIRLWQARAVVTTVGGVQRLDGLMAPMVGRDRELRLIKELFHATEESGRPRLVVVDGDPGVGKSRLVAEFDEYVAGLTSVMAWWHRGRCLSYGDGVAFWALAEALRPRFGLIEGDSGSQSTERFDDTLTGYVPDEQERAWLRPRLAVLLGIGDPGGFTREDLFAAWTAFFEQLGSNGQPVVWVIDDAQHADDGLLDFVEHLLATARVGILVLGLSRPELLARRPHLGGRRTTVVRLDPLDDTAMGYLLDGLVVGLPDAARQTLVQRAEGIPLFAVETVRALVDRDLVVPREGVYVPAESDRLDLDAIGAPASLQALVTARLDGLTAAERCVVADASVLGAAFTRDGLLALAADPGSLEGVLLALQRREIVRLEQDPFSAERGQYRFVQSVVRQVAYATQSKRDRKTRHLAAADHLATLPDADELAVVIAQHLLDAVDASSADDTDVAAITDRARALLRQAAERAEALGAPADALRLLEQALARAHDPAEQADLHLAAARTAELTADEAASATHAAAAMGAYDQLGRPVAAGAAAAQLARVMARQGDNASARALAEEHFAALRPVPGSAASLDALAAALAMSAGRLGDLEAALQWASQRVLLAEGLGRPEGISDALAGLASVYQSIGAPRTSRSLYESAADTAREHGLDDRLAAALLNLSTMISGRDLTSALTHLQEALEPARRSGNRYHDHFIQTNLMLQEWLAGDLEQASHHGSYVREQTTDPALVVTLDLVSLWCAEARGESLPPPPPPFDSDSEADLAWHQVLVVEHARATGDVRRAAAPAAQALHHLLAGMGMDDDFPLLWPPLVLAALAAGDVALAEQLLHPVETAPDGNLSPAVLAQQRRLRGLVAAARGDDAATVETDLREGVQLLSDFGWLTALGPAQEELGRWLAEQSRDVESAEVLAAARATYEQIGATGWLRQLDQQAGADPDQRLARL
jgi:class 3 adenylate cyclase/tetratricopeptide (TPR) repeat protein